jgi:parallel beta-helix repeat protein
MKTVSFLCILVLLLIPHQRAAAAVDSRSGEITLTADQVTSAIDIETAIHQVTLEGTRPGVIILDGRKGPFIYNHPDRSINLFFSNLTLRGVNNAYFPDTDGIYIDGESNDNLVIENLAMNCTGDCLGGVGTHNRVTVRHNLFKTGAMGIGVSGGSRWVITDNTILAQVFAIHLIRTQNATVTHNHLSGFLGIVVEGARLSTIRDNTISAVRPLWQGVLLNGGATRNMIANNSIIGAQQAGISLEAGVARNTIQGNDVLCAYDSPCFTVNAGEAEWAANTIKGNRP